MSERVESLLEQVLEAQRQTNVLLDRLVMVQQALVQALAAEDADPDALPLRDLAGRLIR